MTIRFSPGWWAVGLALAGVVPLAAFQVPFVLPWDDASAGPADLAGWNHPLGADDRVSVNAAGHFEAKGQRMRFVGMNFAADSPFQPTNAADAVAARIAKFGVNCVRFHHLDATWALDGGLIDYGAGGSRKLNRVQLDKLHFLIARLKDHGVYANVNLLVGREFRARDGLPAEIETLPWKDRHIVGLFDPTALALHQEYATLLLTPTNRYTRLPLAQDPAVAFVEILNENGLVQKWYEGVLDTLPAVFDNELNARWNDWLAARYADDTALRAAWKPIDQPVAVNRLRNGAFTEGADGLAFWTREELETAVADFATNNDFFGQPAVKIAIETPGALNYHAQLYQTNLSLTASGLYTYDFWAKASAPTVLNAEVLRSHSGYDPLGGAVTAPLTTNWQRFTGSFQATDTEANARFSFGGFATNRVSVWIARASLERGGRVELSQPLDANLLINGAFTNASAGLADWNPEQLNGAQANFTVVADFQGQPAARIAVVTTSTIPWSIQLNQTNLSLNRGGVYTVSFWAKASQATGLDVNVSRTFGDYGAVGYAGRFELTSAWQQFTATFQATTNTQGNARLNFGGFAGQLGTVWLAEVRLQPGGSLQFEQPFDNDRLVNGAFQDGWTAWNPERHTEVDPNLVADYVVTRDFTNWPSARIAISQPGNADWLVQLNQGLSLVSNQVYTLSYWAKASRAATLSTAVMENHSPYQPLGYSQGVDLTTHWQYFTACFQASATDANARLNFGGFANQAVTVWLAEVHFRPGGQIGALPPDATLAARNLPSVRRAAADDGFTFAARQDWLRFLLELERQYYDAMVGHLRQTCGYPGLIFGTIIANSPPNTQARLDVIDGHAYWQHPQFPPGYEWDANRWTVANTSLANTLGDDNVLAGLARQRVQGKPFTVTEYQHPSPNYFGAEGPLLLAAYGALQDWDGFWLFDYGRGNATDGWGWIHGYFDTGRHPTKMANLLLAAAMFRRGDVRAATREHIMRFTPEIELDILTRRGEAWSVANGRHLKVPGTLAFVDRLSLAVGTNAIGLSAPPAAPSGNVLTSDTGELKWDLSLTNRGVVTVNTPRTKAVVGFADQRRFSLGGVVIQPGSTQLGWATIGLTLLDGDTFANGGNALLIASGQVDNTGMVWKDATHQSLGTNWGGAPTRVEVVPFALTLPVTADRVKVSALDMRGQRLRELSVVSSNGQARFDATANTGTIWYEVRIARNTGFDRWRFAQFTAAELANATLSGVWGTPAGDGTPNLMKYALNLPPKTVVTNALTTGDVYAQAGQSFLTLTFTRVKAATDLTYQPEVSADLGQWQSGTNAIAPLTVVDQGATERVTVRDLIPLTQSARRFLRLKVIQQEP